MAGGSIEEEKARRALAGARRIAHAPGPTWLRRTTGRAPSQRRPRAAAQRRAPAGRGWPARSPNSPLSFSIPAQTARAHGIQAQRARGHGGLRTVVRHL